MGKRLSRKQELFCHEYMVDRNGSAAAVRSGYSKGRANVTACELLKKPAIKAELERLTTVRMDKCDVDAEYVLKGAKEMFERSMQKEEVLDGQGHPTGEWKYDSAGAAKALKIMGDHTDVNAFKGTDDSGNPVDKNWIVTFVDASPNNSKKT